MEVKKNELKKKFLHLLRTYSDEDGPVVSHEALADLLVGEAVAFWKTDLQLVTSRGAEYMKAADGDRRRRVAELSKAGKATSEIAAEIGLTVDIVEDDLDRIRLKEVRSGPPGRRPPGSRGGSS